MGMTSKPAFPMATALVNTCGQIGGATAPLMVGLLLDSYGWDYVFAFMGIGSLLSFLMVSTIVEPINAR
jgi:sugar phosphate permease